MRATRILPYLFLPLFLHGQTPEGSPDQFLATHPDPSLSSERILGIMPSYRAVLDPAAPYRPLRVKDKWKLFVRESVDPYTFVSAAEGAALSQWHRTAPDYGAGAYSYLQRFGAAQTDLTSQYFFSDAVLASLFHEDPRYFRKGRGFSPLHRIGYSISRVVIARKDSGNDGFGFSGIGGMGMGIALSNAYYPAASVNRGEMESRAISSLTSAVFNNLLTEFWPDLRKR